MSAPEHPEGATVRAQPLVFHPVEGRGDCVACHLTLAGGARPLPPAHQEYLAVPCLSCHLPAGGGLSAAYAVPAASLLLCALGLTLVLRRIRRWRR